jgi:pimeloyl-ACP methyl ester carboxylesterase
MGLESIPKFRRNYLIDLYGEETLKELCVAWTTALIDHAEIRGHTKMGDFITKHLHKINCPYLIVHGMKDNLMLPEHALYAKEQVPHAK